MAESSQFWARDQQHSYWGLKLLNYEKKLNKKVRMTVAIPAEPGSEVDESAYRRIKRMKFKCLDTYKSVGNLKPYIDDCKEEASDCTYLNWCTSIIISIRVILMAYLNYYHALSRYHTNFKLFLLRQFQLLG